MLSMARFNKEDSSAYPVMMSENAPLVDVARSQEPRRFGDLGQLEGAHGSLPLRDAPLPFHAAMMGRSRECRRGTAPTAGLKPRG